MDVRYRQKLSIFAEFMLSLADLSCCKRASSKRGAIIYEPDFSHIHAIGYNGPPVGEANDSCRDIPGQCGCVHAEANAIAHLHTEQKNLVMLTHSSPCMLCAGLILNTQQIDTVIYVNMYRDPDGYRRLNQSKVHITCLNSLMGDA